MPIGAEGRRIDLPMNADDAAHRPEYVGPHIKYWQGVTSTNARVLLFEDGTPMVLMRAGSEPKSQERNFRAKNYETGAWDVVLKDYDRLGRGKSHEVGFFMDKLGVILGDNSRRWFFKNFTQTEDTVDKNMETRKWCDERYYVDTGNMMCYDSSADYNALRMYRTVIQRPVEYPRKWA
eukprot:Polyplicarium_translucidae@DN2561_c0_g1_i1.p3